MGFIGAIVAALTAGAFAVAGLPMLNLQSQAGDTVAEFFDHAMGLFSLAMAGADDSRRIGGGSTAGKSVPTPNHRSTSTPRPRLMASSTRSVLSALSRSSCSPHAARTVVRTYSPRGSRTMPLAMGSSFGP
jgi:hypothetical protein